ncbi:pentapeptide repeat-containing protein [Cronbergia sp. UHCC 0137]|uniref:pentapeptide repeat-containing protein n=1 Tax=Cronbergia sp. UHCC 0137 TaxID=3110239 RepID=UPI002B200F74|nr:pentapeptide repeat-containing protein [Cronbergia sp. UHCC 0137]MEA5621228.1 pentapeptide repeat-containing protein [Cronbergia sp. UHCC 0137]
MTTESNPDDIPSPELSHDKDLLPDDFDGDAREHELSSKLLLTQQALTTIANLKSDQIKPGNNQLISVKPRALLLTLLAIALTLLSLFLDISWLGVLSTVITLILSIIILFPWWQNIIKAWFSPQDRTILIASAGLLVGLVGLYKFAGLGDRLQVWASKINWDASGTLAEWFGALGQIFIAIIAVYVAWRQYVISKDLTIQQNLLTVQQNVITQQQTIDSYFQGVSDLVLDEEGLLEDWPQERAIAEGRTAAIFSSVDASGKAKILRFLSRSKLLSPLQRDRRLGRAILNGNGGYAEDRVDGVRVIDLGVMLAGADLSHNDLRWTDLSEANLVRANLQGCDLVKANLSRTILYDADLTGADLNGVRLFYGSLENASPRSRSEPPNYQTGEYTGAVVENADFTQVQRMAESARCYCCTWGGEKTRTTIPGGCEGIINRLGK